MTPGWIVCCRQRGGCRQWRGVSTTEDRIQAAGREQARIADTWPSILSAVSWRLDDVQTTLGRPGIRIAELCRYGDEVPEILSAE